MKVTDWMPLVMVERIVWKNDDGTLQLYPNTELDKDYCTLGINDSIYIKSPRTNTSLVFLVSSRTLDTIHFHCPGLDYTLDMRIS